MDIESIKNIVVPIAKAQLKPALADLSILIPAQVVDSLGHVGVELSGAKRFGEYDYHVTASFSLNPAEQQSAGAIERKAFLATECVKENVFVTLRLGRAHLLAE